MVVDPRSPHGAGPEPVAAESATQHGKWSSARVSKTLWPPQAGTKRLHDRYGDALVCVRYRHDQRTQQRFTTVELVVDQGPLRGRRDGSEPCELDGRTVQGLPTQALEDAGALWDDTAQVWRLRLDAAMALGVEHLVRRGERLVPKSRRARKDIESPT